MWSAAPRQWVTSDVLKDELYGHFGEFSTLPIYVSESETKGWGGWGFSAKSAYDGRGRSQEKVPVGMQELCFPQQKLYLPLQNWPFMCSGKIASACLQQWRPAVAGWFFPYVYLVPWE